MKTVIVMETTMEEAAVAVEEDEDPATGIDPVTDKLVMVEGVGEVVQTTSLPLKSVTTVQTITPVPRVVVLGLMMIMTGFPMIAPQILMMTIMLLAGMVMMVATMLIHQDHLKGAEGVKEVMKGLRQDILMQLRRPVTLHKLSQELLSRRKAQNAKR